jgi:phosphoglycolate phosphatase
MPKDDDVTYKLVIFDFDGTLADSFPWFLDVFDILAERFKFKKLDRSNLEALRRMDNRQLLKALDVPMWKVPMIGAHAKAMQGENVDKINLFEGVADVLYELHRRGVQIAVVTSNSRENVEKVLGPSTANISHYECGASLFGKAAKFRSAMKAAGVTASETLSIGDEVRDIEAARECGIAAGAVTWGYAAPDRLEAERPDHMFALPSDIIAAI